MRKLIYKLFPCLIAIKFHSKNGLLNYNNILSHFGYKASNSPPQKQKSLDFKG